MGRGHKLLLLGSLYLAQGLPYGFFTQALPVLMRESGASLKAISATSLLFAPWALKFLWAPLVDHVGTRKQWILPLQLAAASGAALLALTDAQHSFTLIFAVLLAFNLLAAMQDVATDGLAVCLLSSDERGLGNGLQVGAYRVGMILGGWLAWRLGRRSALIVCGVLQTLSLVPYGISALGHGGRELLYAACAAEHLLGGMATVALFTLMMDAAEPDHAGTDYTLLACAVVIATGLAAFAGGALGDAVGYAPMFFAAVLLSAAGCAALVLALDRRRGPSRLQSVWPVAELAGA
jgi:MFS family permease